MWAKASLRRVADGGGASGFKGNIGMYVYTYIYIQYPFLGYGFRVTRDGGFEGLEGFKCFMDFKVLMHK